jgi:solute carrier family 7 (L-type amino acid transporter), member 9/15
MAVAAANRDWLPRVFARLGRVGVETMKSGEGEDLARDAARDAAEVSADPPGETPEQASTAESDAPINAIILSTIISIFYILLGNFRALLTFNGLGEFSFFFLTVVGAIILRFREPELKRPYKPFILIPVVFAVLSGFVVIRGAIFALVPAAVLVALWILGGVLYYGNLEYARRQVS